MCMNASTPVRQEAFKIVLVLKRKKHIKIVLLNLVFILPYLMIESLSYDHEDSFMRDMIKELVETFFVTASSVVPYAYE